MCVCVCACAAESVCSGCGCLSPCIRLLSRSGLLAFLGSFPPCPTSSLSGLELGALVEEGGMLQDPVQPQTLPEASLQLPLPSFSPFPPSLSFLSSLPPKAGVPGGGTCQSLAVPLRLPAQGAAPPGSQVFGSLETPPAPGEAVGLRTLQTLLQSHGDDLPLRKPCTATRGRGCPPQPQPTTMNTSAPPAVSPNITVLAPGKGPWQVAFIGITTGLLSLATVTGNLLVLISFKVNTELKTVNNYFLLSLACADLIIGTFSMNLYTTYLLMGHWALGTLACDLWLALDYVASNASVMNLLLISFDRYFSVTRPLSYRAKRTPRRAALMIGLAWLVSFILWAPAILFWQYLVGERTVLAGQCYIQFLSQPIITFGTAMAAFYLPVTVMCTLYWRIYRETENRARELAALQGSETPGKGGGSSSSSERSQRGTEGSPETPPGRCCRCCRAPRLLQAYSWKEEEEEDEGSMESLTSSEGEEPGSEVVIKMPMVDPEAQAPAKQPPRSSPNTVKRPTRKGRERAGKSQKPRGKEQLAKRKTFSLVKEKKAARTLSAILLAFIVTWTPYNIMVLVSTFCKNCVPETLWELGYWLCYVNSTINPMCYALCNKAFRDTFRLLLLCRWDKRRWRKIPKRPGSVHRTPSRQC
ncbi:muscarinic acetylcholine receptor M1 isoform X2 [Mustela erminea]|uniref:muscarinic acetylcholine receptor M1 isoform X2 n=1 Tax=Mustela erminea TaxID=36723 RepID=UPI001386754C|nr:muscarinic acetylcholine receptor M1 isoform X2 [Mustela erminea]